MDRRGFTYFSNSLRGLTSLQMSQANDTHTKEDQLYSFLKMIESIENKDNDINKICLTLYNFISSIDKKTFINYSDNIDHILKFVQIVNKYCLYFIHKNPPDKSTELLLFAKKMLDVNEILEESEIYKSVLCNLGSYCTYIKKYDLAIQFLEQAALQFNQVLDSKDCIILNNLAGLYIQVNNFDAAIKFTQRCLVQIEPYIFTQKNNYSDDQLKNNDDFFNNLMILLMGYLNMGFCVQQSSVEANKDFLSFYKNAYKLSRKYLGDEHPLTKKAHYYCFQNDDEQIAVSRSQSQLNSSYKLEDNQRQNLTNLLAASLQVPKQQRSINSKVDYNSLRKSKDFRINHNSNSVSLSNKSGFIHSKNIKHTHEPENEYYQLTSSTNHAMVSNEQLKELKETREIIRELEQNIQSIKGLKEKYRKEQQEFNEQILDLKSQKTEYEQLLSEADIYDKIHMVEQEKLQTQTKLKELQLKIDLFKKENERILQQKIEYEIEIEKLKQSIAYYSNNSNSQKIMQRNDSDKLTNKLSRFDRQRDAQSAKSIPTQSDEILENKPTYGLQNITQNSSLYQDSQQRKFKLKLDEVSRDEDQIQREQKNDIPYKQIVIAQNPQTQTIVRQESKQTNNNNQTKNIKSQNNSQLSQQQQMQNKQQQENEKRKDIQGQQIPQQGNSVQKNQNKQVISPQGHRQIKTQFQQPQQGINLNNDEQNDNKLSEAQQQNNNNSFNRNYSYSQLINNTQSLESILINPDPSHLLSFPEFFNLPKNATAKKRVFIDDMFFLIEVILTKALTGQHILKISAKLDPFLGQQIEQKIIVKDETLTYETFKKITKHLDYKQSLSSTVPLKSIRNFKTFAQYFILPFIGIKTEGSNTNKRKITIWNEPLSYFKEPIKCQFLNEECFISDTIIGSVIYNTLSKIYKRFREQYYLIDLVIEIQTLKKYFECLEVPENEKNQDINEITKVVETFEDNDSEETDNIEAKQQSEHTFIENYVLINPDICLAIDKIIQELNIFYKEKGYNNFNQLSQDQTFKYGYVRVKNEFQKMTICLIVENNSKQVFEIYLKNTYETYGKSINFLQLQKVKRQKPKDLQSISLITCGKILVSNSLNQTIWIKQYGLDVHEKELDPDDYDRYEVNPISKQLYECGGYYRSYVGEIYKFPVTLSLVGLAGNLYGIKISIFQINQRAENGIFLVCNDETWRKAINPSDTKKKKKYTNTNTIEENYQILYILKKIGWKIIFDNIIFDNFPNKSEIQGRKLLTGLSCHDQLENYYKSSSES